MTNIPYSVASNAEQFLLGIAVEEAANNKDKEKAVAKIEATIQKVRSDLREAYDKFIPNVLVLDIDNFTNLIANRITQNPEKFLDEFSTFQLNDRFANKNSEEYKKLHRYIKRLVHQYHSSLLKNQTTTNPLHDLNELAKKLFVRTRKIDNNISARTLGIAFSKNIRTVFGNRAVMAVIDPKLGSSDNRYIFFSSSFLSIGASIRDKVYSPLVDYLRKRLLGGELETRSDIKIGETINLGHAALVNELGAYVNSPAFAKSLFTVAKGGSKKFAPAQIVEAAEFFKKESRILENKIEVAKEFTTSDKGYGVLLALGVTWTNLEDAAINSDRGRRYEGPTARLIGSTTPAKLTPSQLRTLTAKLVSAVWKLNPVLGRSGKNLAEYLALSIGNTIQGKKTAPVRYKKAVTKKTTRVEYKPVNKTVIERNYSELNPSVIGLIEKPSRGPESSLAVLLNLLNADLVDRVKQNMGDGNARNVLNLRTGRFAESVKVERLSESRAGMITAFYSYMKNPYATFSEGGRQQYPKTRDPKLLISKSIREIASAQVANRLRAVLV